jgi:hypothetical protein
MAATKQPWIVLVCQFSDDADPANVLVRNLPGLDPAALADTGTVLDLFKMFFTTQGNNTFNAIRYFNEMSHGTIDLNDSQVVVVNLNWTKAQADALAINPGGASYEAMVTTAAQTAAQQQGVQLQNFYGIVITSHYMLSMAQGGSIPGGAIVVGPVGWAGMDYRWVRNNGIQSWGQEMGHGFGLDHSRIDGNPADYMDPWDVMSTRNAFSGPDPNYGARGPGINAWNMRCRSWLDETRVWHCPLGTFKQTLQLRPLHRKDLVGYLAAELPPLNHTSGFPQYLVEYRKRENWDNGIPRSCVLVHRFEGALGQFMGTHSYVMKGTKGQSDLVAGDSFGMTTWFGPVGPQLHVISIDDNTSTATLLLEMYQDHGWYPPPLYNPWWWIETRGGLVPPGPPPPWDVINRLSAIAALAQIAQTAAPDLRRSVLEIALKEVGLISRDLEKQLKDGHTTSHP